MEEAKWYIAHTFAGYENKVANDLRVKVENQNLTDMIQKVVVPTETVIEKKVVDKKVVNESGDKVTEKVTVEKEVERKLFPSYVFVKMVMTDETWYIVRNTSGCAGFVGPEGVPVPLTEQEINDLGLKESKVRVEVAYAEGDQVNVISGPFAGTVGTVKEVDIDNNKAVVITAMFGRESEVDFELDALEKISE